MTPEEQKEYHKRYYAANKEHLKSQMKEYGVVWRQNNKEKIKQKNSNYSKTEKSKQTKANWRRDNPEKVREFSLKKNYGITLEQYNQMLNEQNGACKICKEISDKTLHVDHCHKTDKVRGLLCLKCNTLLGNARESKEVLLSAIEYLNGFA